MASKTILLLAIIYSMILVISSQAPAANDSSLTHDSAQVEEGKGYRDDDGYYYGGHGGYDDDGRYDGGYGGYDGRHRGYYGRRGGDYCRYGCCGQRRHSHGRCWCCRSFAEANAYQQAQTNN